jgi:hypothetical protein
LAVLLPYVMLQGSVLVCTILLDVRVTSAALVTTSILNVCVSITCVQKSSNNCLFCESVWQNSVL